MSCPSLIELSRFADAESEASAAAEIEGHIEACRQCAASVSALRQEGAWLRASLSEIEQVAIPKFEPPLTMRDLLTAALGGIGLLWLASTVWTLAAAAVPAGLRWVDPFDLRYLSGTVADVIVLLIQEGSAMVSSMMNIGAVVVAIAFVAWWARSVRRIRAVTSMLSVALVVAMVPAMSHAFEMRGGDDVVVEAGETIDDTLIATGETVTIDGDVTGDLFAFGRRVTIRGNVGGDLITAAETVTVEGTIGGNVFGGAGSLEVDGGTVAGNLYGAAGEVSVRAESEVAGNALAFAERIDIAGSVAQDVRSYGRILEIRGTVGRNVDFHGDEVDVAGSGSVGGDLTSTLDDTDNISIAGGATIVGEVVTLLNEGRERLDRNRYLSVGFYVGQIVRLGSSFIAGLLALWIFASLRTVSIRTVVDGLKAGGVGLVALIMTPVAAVIAGVTIVGLPVAVIAVMIWLVGLYFAKIVVAQLVGRRLLESDGPPRHFALTLLVGLVIVLVAVNLPFFIGGLVSFVLTLIGLGLLVSVVYTSLLARSASKAAV